MTELKKSCIIYAHFDKHDIVDPHVIYQLTKLNEFVDRIIFVSTSRLDKQETEKLSGLNVDIYLRENVGIDFFSWKLGLSKLRDRKLNFDRIIFMNDSCYGPWRPLDDLFQRLDESQSQVIAASQSLQIRHHFQTFFIVYQNGMQNHTILDEYYNAIMALDSKNEMIERYEIPLKRWFESRGATTDSILPLFFMDRIGRLISTVIQLFKLRPIHARRYFREALLVPAINPSHEKAETIMLSIFPFLKVELMRDNPTNVDLSNINRTMTVNVELKNLVLQHLARINPKNNT